MADIKPEYVCMHCGSDSCKPIFREESYTCSVCGCWDELVLKTDLNSSQPVKENPLESLVAELK